MWFSFLFWQTSDVPLIYASPGTVTESLKETEETNLIIDYPIPTVPFHILDSTGVPLKPGDSDSPPPADQSASHDFSPGYSEMPTEQSFTLAEYTAGSSTLDIFQKDVTDQMSEDEKMKDKVFGTELSILPDQGRLIPLFMK